MIGEGQEDTALRNNGSGRGDELYEENDDDEEDVTFLICGGNDQGGLKDFSKLNGSDSPSAESDLSNLASDPLKKGGGAVDLRSTNTVASSASSLNASNQRVNAGYQNLHSLNASNTIYIDNEDTTAEENPCKNLQMVWDNNPELRPWSRLLDVSPWFNYGFTEKTFKEYIIRQLGIRWERIKKQNIETSDDLLNTVASGIPNPSSINPNLNVNMNNPNAGIPNPNIKMMNNFPSPPIAGFPSNMMYFPPPPPPHLNPPIPGHPNIYHQQHMFGNFPHHIPHHSHMPPPIPSPIPHQAIHHPGLPANNISSGGANTAFNMRGKKRPQE